MKKEEFLRIILLYIFLTINSLSCFCQDTLYLKTNEKIAVKVDEVSATEIKYRRWDILDGPKYSKSTNDVQSIRYQNGTADYFQTTTNVASPSQGLQSPD